MTNVVTIYSQNLQRVTENSDRLRLASFVEDLRAKKPDIVFVQEVGEGFGLDASLGYGEIGVAVNKKNVKTKGGTDTSPASQLNLKVFIRIGATHVKPLSSRAVSIEGQRRKAVEIALRVAGVEIVAQNVHAGAHPIPGSKAIMHAIRAATRNPFFISVGDHNFDLLTLSSKNLTFDITPFLAPVLDRDGAIAATRIGAEGQKSALDYAVFGRRLQVIPHSVSRPIFTHPTRLPRTVKTKNLVRYPIDHSGVFMSVVVHGAESAISESRKRFREYESRPEEVDAEAVRVLEEHPDRLFLSDRRFREFSESEPVIGLNKRQRTSLDSRYSRSPGAEAEPAGGSPLISRVEPMAEADPAELALLDRLAALPAPPNRPIELAGESALEAGPVAAGRAAEAPEIVPLL